MAAPHVGVGTTPHPAQNRLSKLRTESRAWQWHGDGSRSSWDGLRRDSDLWIPNGDCVVYLYDEGQSQRGPSIRIPYDLLFEARCTSLTVFATSEPDDDTSSGRRRGSSTVSGRDNLSETIPISKRLYLGAPSDLPREEAFSWHVTTRNVFAWLLGKPLVGASLSRAMIDLLGRMTIYRESSVDNVGDLLEYADSVGYSDFSGRPDLALAMLSFADEFKLADAWIDAFAHCVGMHEDLSQCQEYAATRNVSKALITRAALQMDLRLDRATRAIDTLVEEDLSSACVDLPVGVRRHLDYFRTFLQSHFVASYGYWPAREEIFSKALYVSMLGEFDSLYQYLADKESINGGVEAEQSTADALCVGQITDSLDHRHGFEPLQFTLPLLPEIHTGAGHRTQANWALRNWKLGTKDHKLSAADLVRSAYVKASNRTDSSVLDSSLVQAYIRFESELSKNFDDKLSFGDARKTRWIMVYQMLQRLISITQAPEEVRDTESAPYPLCCPVTGVPPWSVILTGSPNTAVDEARASTNPSKTSSFSASQSSEVTQSARLDDGPDDDVSYFNHQNLTDASSSRDSTTWLSGALPEKSYRRSLLANKAPSCTISKYAPASLAIPNRSSSKTSKSSLDNRESSASSDTDTAPSLHWSQGSPASISSSDEPRSPVSSSSSVYSTDLPASSPRKQEESFDKDFWAEGGEFICPGLSS